MKAHLSRLILSAACAASLAWAEKSPLTPVPPDFAELLRTLGASKHDLRSELPEGQTALLSLPPGQEGELAVGGAERLEVPLDFFLKAFHQDPVVRHRQQILLTHQFSDPPRIRDLAPFRLEPDEVRDLLRCTPGDCGVKLSAPLMDRFHGSGDPDAVEARFRAAILGVVTRYLKYGDSVLSVYVDKEAPADGAADFHALLGEAAWLRDQAGPLYRCLEHFTGGACPRVQSFLYWSSVKFGLKPIFSVTHVMLYRTVKNAHPWVFIAFKQVYADHYFDGSMGLAVLTEQPAGVQPALWLLYVNRSMTDALGGWIGPLKRGVTREKARAALKRNLEELKSNVEARFAGLRGWGS